MSLPGQIVTRVCVCVLTEYKERGKVTSKWFDCVLRASVPIFLSQISLLQGAGRSNAELLQACHLLTSTIQHPPCLLFVSITGIL